MQSAGSSLSWRRLPAVLCCCQALLAQWQWFVWSASGSRTRKMAGETFESRQAMCGSYTSRCRSTWEGWQQRGAAAFKRWNPANSWPRGVICVLSPSGIMSCVERLSSVFTASSMTPTGEKAPLTSRVLPLLELQRGLAPSGVANVIWTTSSSSTRLVRWHCNVASAPCARASYTKTPSFGASRIGAKALSRAIHTVAMRAQYG